MKSVQLVLTLNKAKMLEAARGDASYNIGTMIESIPSVTIVSGDPTVAVRVEVDTRYAEILRQAVRDHCTVGAYREFALLDAGRSLLGAGRNLLAGRN
jgi:hypothetical protein